MEPTLVLTLTLNSFFDNLTNAKLACCDGCAHANVLNGLADLVRFPLLPNNTFPVNGGARSVENCK
jgi:hypothetical protein